LDRITILVPTYNRPLELRRLLAYFAACRAVPRILVLDSSAGDALAANRASVEEHGNGRRLRLPIETREYPSSMPPYEKFAAGLRQVSTPYCVFCADDDVIFLPAVAECVTLMETRKDFSVAHGYYFNFREAGAIRLAYVQYAGGSIELDDPVFRLRAFMANYEATFYGVHRTDDLARIMDVACRMRSTLFRELAAASSALAAGKMARIPRMYYGRNTAPSVSYDNWHPHQILAGDPELLFAEYAAYRDVVLDELAFARPAGPDRPTLARMLDHIHLKYLRQILDPRVMDFMLDEVMRGTPTKALVGRVWSTWVANTERLPHPVRRYPPCDDARKRRAFLRALTTRVLDRVRGVPHPVRRAFHPYRDYRIDSQTARGLPRTYIVQDEFLFPDDRPDFSPSDAQIGEVVAEMAKFATMDEVRAMR
jgi:glycosyltransferase domain-containing protein